jgi:hypothetical protein
LQKFEGLTIVEGNASETDFAKVAGADQVVVVGNLPYHLSSPILFQVLDQVSHVPRAVRFVDTRRRTSRAPHRPPSLMHRACNVCNAMAKSADRSGSLDSTDDKISSGPLYISF